MRRWRWLQRKFNKLESLLLVAWLVAAVLVWRVVEIWLAISKLAVGALLVVVPILFKLFQRLDAYRLCRAVERGHEAYRYRYRRGRRSDLRYVTQKGHEVFGSPGYPNGSRGRHRHDRQLLLAYNGGFFILEYREQHPTDGRAWTPKGYSVIFALKPDVSRDYLEGGVDQFRLKPSDLQTPSDMAEVTDPPVLYFKALFTDPEHQTRNASVVPRLKMVANHVARVIARYNGRDFTLIAEGVTEDGRLLMQKYGFRHTGVSSPSGHGIYRFDSAMRLNAFGRHFVKEVNRARKWKRDPTPKPQGSTRLFGPSAPELSQLRMAPPKGTPQS